jgi:3-keto-5-aminohexanoate cleavage enzyme
MTTPCIITVAITGSLPQKSDNPAVPISIAEQIDGPAGLLDRTAKQHIGALKTSPTGSRAASGRR